MLIWSLVWDLLEYIDSILGTHLVSACQEGISSVRAETHVFFLRVPKTVLGNMAALAAVDAGFEFLCL